MSKKDEFKGYLIPDQYLENIKGGGYIGGLGQSFCPKCGSYNLIATTTIPPVYTCWDCNARWFIQDNPKNSYVIIKMQSDGEIRIEKNEDNYV